MQLKQSQVDYKMKTQDQITPQSVYPKRPFTSQLDFQTKIRQVIQDVISGTIRRLTKLSQKVNYFQEFINNYQEKMSIREVKDKEYEQNFMRLQELVKKNQENNQMNFMKNEKDLSIIASENKKIEHDITYTLTKEMRLLRWQNQNINNQMGRKNNQMTDLQRKISEMKEHVSLEITKYIEETAKQNASMMSKSISFEAEYQKIMQIYENNRKKYQQILEGKQYQDQLIRNQATQIKTVQISLEEEIEATKKLKYRIQDSQTNLNLKIKQVESKNDKNYQYIKENHIKIKQLSDKIQKMGTNLQEIKQNISFTKSQIYKKMEQKLQKEQQKRKIQQSQILTRQEIYQKQTNKKLNQLDAYQQKILQIMNQKLSKLKTTIQKQLQVKFTKITKQQNQGSLAMNLVKQIQQKLHKNQKQVKKIFADIKQVQMGLENKIQMNKENTQKKLEVTIKNYEKSNAGMNNQILKMVEEKIDKFIDQNKRIQRLDKFKADMQIQFKQFLSENSHRFSQLDREVNKKIEKTLYMIQKFKGDTIITNQFIEKRIEELKTSLLKQQKSTSSILKVLPGLCECLNVSICLIYDNQLQNIYRNNDQDEEILSLIPKRLANKVDGAIYELNQKRRSGFINYRHKQQRKISILKAIFDSYIKIWQELSLNDFKDQHQLLPKQFYKKYVNNSSINQKQRKQNNSGHLKSFENIEQEETMNNGRQNTQNNVDNISKTFQIRRKRTTVMKTSQAVDQTLDQK